MVWLLSQLNPSIPLLGAGVVSDVMRVAWDLSAGETLFQAPQAVGVALNFCGMGLFVSTLSRRARYSVVIVALLVALAMLLKWMTAAMLLKPQAAVHWLGPETLVGLAIGSVFLLMLLAIPLRPRSYFAAVIILAGALMSKLAGTYASLSSVLRLFNWPYGQLLNFTGLTLYLNEIWPLAALIFLLIYIERQRALDGALRMRDRL